MNLENLQDHLSYLSYAFRTLTTEEQMKLVHSLTVLQRMQRLDAVYFLGRLEGCEADYMLAFGCPDKDIFHDRKLFYSLDLTDWYQLLEPKNWSSNWDQVQCSFRGDPAFRVEEDLGPSYTLDEDLVPVVEERIRPKMKEQNRLWFVISRILEEAAIVPRGVLYHCTEGRSVVNPFFRGISVNDSLKLHNYHHFRKPIGEPQENLLKRDDCSYFLDVFDPVDDLIPAEQSFAVTRDLQRDVFVMKSLHWPGMLNFHRSNSNVYGFFYFGDGRKNWDLLFKI
ncbi:radial spoke head protein 9 homolog [Topomyia yanbarensis]|uniref:radial spoke head protein 9 homolog n=1 Tax=Topomyia yanbarensis TaxID=2498891 RepID=UPI00273C2628|nr:radial spoke head protein 9 homolog [Topomyia yanbarensis]